MLILANSVCALIVLWTAIMASNRMTAETRACVRAAYVLLGTGALGSLLLPFVTVPKFLSPTPIEFLVILGITLFCVADQRRRYRRLN